MPLSKRLIENSLLKSLFAKGWAAPREPRRGSCVQGLCLPTASTKPWPLVKIIQKEGNWGEEGYPDFSSCHGLPPAKPFRPASTTRAVEKMGQEVRKAMEGFPEGIKRKLSAMPDWTENPPLRNALADLELWVPGRCLEGNPCSVAGRTLTCSLNYHSIL